MVFIGERDRIGRIQQAAQAVEDNRTGLTVEQAAAEFGVDPAAVQDKVNFDRRKPRQFNVGRGSEVQDARARAVREIRPGVFQIKEADGSTRVVSGADADRLGFTKPNVRSNTQNTAVNDATVQTREQRQPLMNAADPLRDAPTLNLTSQVTDTTRPAATGTLTASQTGRPGFFSNLLSPVSGFFQRRVEDAQQEQDFRRATGRDPSAFVAFQQGFSRQASSSVNNPVRTAAIAGGTAAATAVAPAAVGVVGIAALAGTVGFKTVTDPEFRTKEGVSEFAGGVAADAVVFGAGAKAGLKFRQTKFFQDIPSTSARLLADKTGGVKSGKSPRSKAQLRKESFGRGQPPNVRQLDPLTVQRRTGKGTITERRIPSEGASSTKVQAPDQGRITVVNPKRSSEVFVRREVFRPERSTTDLVLPKTRGRTIVDVDKGTVRPVPTGRKGFPEAFGSQRLSQVSKQKITVLEQVSRGRLPKDALVRRPQNTILITKKPPKTKVIEEAIPLEKVGVKEQIPRGFRPGQRERLLQRLKSRIKESESRVRGDVAVRKTSQPESTSKTSTGKADLSENRFSSLGKRTRLLPVDEIPVQAGVTSLPSRPLPPGASVVRTGLPPRQLPIAPLSTGGAGVNVGFVSPGLQAQFNSQRLFQETRINQVSGSGVRISPITDARSDVTPAIDSRSLTSTKSVQDQISLPKPIEDSVGKFRGDGPAIPVPPREPPFRGPPQRRPPTRPRVPVPPPPPPTPGRPRRIFIDDPTYKFGLPELPRDKGSRESGFGNFFKIKQPKAFTPSATSFSFGIRGGASKIGEVSGLGIRPLPAVKKSGKSRKKKKK